MDDLAETPIYEASGVAPRDRVKVLYIAGYSRSGSTILDSILGQVDGFFSTGELYYLWGRNILDNTICGCGAPFRECQVWNGVFDGAFGGMDRVNAREMIRAQESNTRTRHIPIAAVPWGRRLLRSRSRQYLERLKVLYQQIQASTGCRVIVDSSKVPLYGYLLSTIPSIDLYVVHLIRDPRAASYSWLKKRLLPPLPGKKEEALYMDRYSVTRSSMVWNVTNLAVEMFWRGQPNKYLMLRYEDFVIRPQENLQRIVELVNEQDKSAHPPFVAERTIELGSNHTTSAIRVGSRPGR